MELTMIGTGSAFSKKFYNNSALVTFSSGYNLLIDCGHSVPKGLADKKISWESIDGILITHTHADHIGGLEEAALYNKFVLDNRKIDLFVPEALVKSLWDESLKGGLKYGDDRDLTLYDYFNVHPVFTDYYEKIGRDNHGEIFMVNTNHVWGMKSYAVGLIDRGERKVFYTSDTVFDKKLVSFAAFKGYERIFHDCQLYTGGVHASLEELLEGIPEVVQRRVMLMHYGDNMEDFIGKTGNMQFARQGCTYII
ncbi:ribonuclease Z [Bacillus phage 015DV004]|nr:ribonuclease Z [Bacillus phage 015DV004]